MWIKLRSLFLKRFPNKEGQIIGQIGKYPYVIVYGAGLVGTLVVKRLLENGVKEDKIFVAVSKIQSNHMDSLSGINVFVIDELLQYASSALVIIATMPVLHEEILQYLYKKGFHNIIGVSDSIYAHMTKRYVECFNKKYPINMHSEAKTKIMFLSSDNSVTSGAFLCMVDLCKLLKQYGVEVVVVLPCYGNGEMLLQNTGVYYTYVLSKHWGYETVRNHDLLYKCKFKLKLCQNKRAIKKLSYMINQYGIDIVHCNTSYTYVGAVAAKQLGIPIVWHIREDMKVQGFQFFNDKKARSLIESSKLIVYVSEYIKSKILLNNHRSVVLYDAINYTTNDNQGSKDILSKPKIKMILVGAITPHKGQNDLIEACSILKRNNIVSFELLIVGKGNESYVENLKQQVKSYQLEKEIIFFGQSNAVDRLFEESDISFMCSTAEPYGRVTIEAQLAGCLVIGAASGATPELIVDGKTGYLYEAGNVEELAKCILKAISDVKRSRKIAELGQNYAKKTYSTFNQLKGVISLYENILERKLI